MKGIRKMKIIITSNGHGLASVKLGYKNKMYVEHWEDRGNDGLICNDSIEKQLGDAVLEPTEVEQITEMLDNIDIDDIMESSEMEEQE